MERRTVVCLTGILLVATIAGRLAFAQGEGRERRHTQTVISPEVLPDNRVTLRLHAPNARNVSVWGEWVAEGLEQGRELRPDARGLWTITFGPLPPDFYNYRFNVDGTRMADPTNRLGFRSDYSILSVPGEARSFADNQEVPHGQIRQVWYKSSTLSEQRRLHVYTPPDYDQDERPYPVLYLFHGGGGDDSSWANVGRAGFILDNLIAQSKAVPMVIAMPNGSLPEGVPFPRIVPELMNDVIPLVERTFRVQADTAHRAVAGYSMGGAHTLRVASTEFKNFAYIGVWSTGVTLPDDAPILTDANEFGMHPKLFSISVGENDRMLDGSKLTSDKLRLRSVEHTLEISAGGHTTMNVRRYLHTFAQLLFR